MISETIKCDTHLIKRNGAFPNNELLPVIIYKQAILTEGKAIAAEMERVFLTNRWERAWRNSIYNYHHYHSTAHEVLGICRGEVTVQLGGPDGLTINLTPGDVLVLPAGVAHKNEHSSDDFACVGAYPEGQDYDMNYGKEGERPKADKNISDVPLPLFDPVYGKNGSLHQHWKL